jgi:glycosyltransferase involved in cell wall biosynthesis
MVSRIVIATTLRQHGDTGVQTHVQAVVDFLKSDHVSVEVVTPFAWRRALALPVFAMRRAIERVDRRLGVWWYRKWHYEFLRAGLKRALARGDDAVVLAQCPPSARAALEARHSPRQRVFLVVHFNVSQADEWASKGEIHPSDWVYRQIIALEEEVLPRVDGLVFVSEFMRDQVLARIPATRRVPHVVVPNFLPRLSSPPPGVDPADLITIGTLEPRKNQGYLLEVLAAARRLGRRYTLNVVGDGQDRAALERLAVCLGVRDQVRFLGRQPEARRFITGHRAYLHAARMENSPLVVIEAFSYGIPVFAGAVGGIPEMIRDGYDGVLWPLDDAEEAARRLIAEIESPERSHALAEGARRAFAERFDTKVLAARLFAFVSTSGLAQLWAELGSMGI